MSIRKDRNMEEEKEIHVNNRVSLTDAAKELGMSEQSVREHMKRKVIDIGYVLPSMVGEKNIYVVYRDKLNKFLGKS